MYLDADWWRQITAEKRDELKEKLAGLPSAYKDEENSEEAKRFDLLALRLQLGLLVGDPGYDALRQQVQRIAEDLLDPTTLNDLVVSFYTPASSPRYPVTTGGRTSRCRCWSTCGG